MGRLAAPFTKALGAMYKHLTLVLFCIFSLSSFANEVLWREDNKALAVCKVIEESVCIVIVNNISTDVSVIESKNILGLGITPKSKYEKVITFPSKWKRSSTDGDLIVFTTQAWLNGQKFIRRGLVFVDSDGKYIHQ